MAGSQRHSKALRLIFSAQHAGRYPTQVLGFCMKEWIHGHMSSSPLGGKGDLPCPAASP